jgi:hypothetical protein
MFFLFCKIINILNGQNKKNIRKAPLIILIRVVIIILLINVSHDNFKFEKIMK